MLALPPVSIPCEDLGRLRPLVAEIRPGVDATVDFLRSELGRAIVLEDDVQSRDIVRLNVWVTYRIDWGPSESRILVHPDDYASDDLHLSVMSPAGAALIGLEVGSRMPFLMENALHLMTAVSVRREPTTLGLFRTRASIPGGA